MRRFTLVSLLMLGSGCLLAQDTDTVLLKNDRQKFTILSQIEDPREVSAFLTILHAQDAAARHESAVQFVTAYPQSWLLAQVYDLAARASIDLNDYDHALEESHFSLRLLPENPTLLVLIANMEARKGLLDEAESDAHSALDYLEEIERPANLTETEWKSIRPELKASGYFALGRAEAARGLARKGLNAAPALMQAIALLDRAAAWNSNDPEIFYLRAIIALNLHRTPKATADLLFVSRSASPLHVNAEKVLRTLYKNEIGQQQMSWEQWLSAIAKPEIDKQLCKDEPVSKKSNAIAGGYAGPDACQSCHVREYDTWRQTGMARMLQPYQAGNIIGDFSSAEFRESEKDAVRVGHNTRPYFEVQTGRGQWERFYVDFTIGSKWQQAYATKSFDGSLHVLPIQYNAALKRWINYWKIIDPAGSERTAISEFPKMLASTNYQQNCAICHTSQLKAPSSVERPTEHAVFLQPGVDCEMCHGPSAWHVKQIRNGHIEHRDPMEPPVDFRRIGNREGVAICAQCHRQSAVREIGLNNEMNYSTENGSFVAKAWTRSLDAFSRKAFYKDGRFRETTFIVEAFTRSACYRKGGAQCATCHAPHVPDFAHNLTSLKSASEPDEMCFECHSQYRSNVSKHTHHPENAEASRCVSCHMPRIVNALLFKARSHQIEIPTADLTERFGQAESPNACLFCHSGRTAQWAVQQLSKWHG